MVRNGNNGVNNIKGMAVKWQSMAIINNDNQYQQYHINK
jgi:hypothetical protein